MDSTDLLLISMLLEVYARLLTLYLDTFLPVFSQDVEVLFALT